MYGENPNSLVNSFICVAASIDPKLGSSYTETKSLSWRSPLFNLKKTRKSYAKCISKNGLKILSIFLKKFKIKVINFLFLLLTFI